MQKGKKQKKGKAKEIIRPIYQEPPPHHLYLHLHRLLRPVPIVPSLLSHRRMDAFRQIVLPPFLGAGLKALPHRRRALGGHEPRRGAEVVVVAFEKQVQDRGNVALDFG
ncbi:hypothetical protein I7I53_05973 [Histoplasma capsulatum var. duboisii H88]|uniref:Uncharacterized protein n=1 Tax=Ajellomyces capsulatus (strain H88) TaxID=544711 RepID=A0A8A1LAX8_AJEC8|nr:hypothetical protein I7I53_05973 [Histoplasma capsulatum var. duboisii H88]